MNHHELIDHLAVHLSTLVQGRYQFFSARLESPRLAVHLEAVRLHLPRIAGTGMYEVRVETLVGRLTPAFCIVQWLGKEYPTILWHHGNAERPFEFRRFSHTSFNQIFLRANGPLPVNLIALAAPFHRRSLILYAEQLRDLAKFGAMLAVSTRLVEALISYVKARTASRVMVAGISLGGWVTNLHRAYYNTADLYVPLFAGAALDEVFTASLYRHLTGRLALEHPEQLKKVLNFEPEFTRKSENNVFPLLARHDQIVPFARHRLCYGNQPITVLEKGHITASLAHHALRQHLLEQLTRRTSDRP